MRFDDWQKKLGEVIRAAAGKPFEWGNHDCALFACNAVLAMTGEDPAKSFRGKYKTKRGAYGALKRFAGGGLKETFRKLAKQFGFIELDNAAFAKRGDVVLIGTPDGDALAVVDLTGRHCLVVSEKGLITKPLSLATIAWTID